MVMTCRSRKIQPVMITEHIKHVNRVSEEGKRKKCNLAGGTEMPAFEEGAALKEQGECAGNFEVHDPKNVALLECVALCCIARRY